MKIDYDRLTEGVDNIISKASALPKRPVVKVIVDGGKNLDPKVIAANLRRLNESCLHYVWQPADEQQTSSLAFDERPADLDAELLRLAKDALGSEDAATLAVRDLLPPAAGGNPSAVLDIVWDIFKKKLKDSDGHDNDDADASIRAAVSSSSASATAVGVNSKMNSVLSDIAKESHNLSDGTKEKEKGVARKRHD
jgi:hypothetical protein